MLCWPKSRRHAGGQRQIVLSLDVYLAKGDESCYWSPH